MTDLLLRCPLIKSCEEALDAAFTVHRYYGADDKAALLAEVGPRIRAVATDGHYGCSADIRAACPNIEVISSYGVGYDGIDVDACKAEGIRVGNTPDVLNDAVAELTLGLMLALSRQIPQADAYVRAGDWEAKGAYPLTTELTGRRVGILGLGRIGKEIAARCQAMKMQVVYHGRTEQAHCPYPYYADLTAMARDVDWLVLIAPGGAGTKGIVSRAVLEALGPEGRLLNIARGSLVDEAAMIDLLASGTLGGAALDVFEDEPRMADQLKALPNVVLSPHNGSATTKTRWAMGDLVVRNLTEHFAGRPLVSAVV